MNQPHRRASLLRKPRGLCSTCFYVPFTRRALTAPSVGGITEVSEVFEFCVPDQCKPASVIAPRLVKRRVALCRGMLSVRD
jgi:hypothetical protein